MQSHKTYTLEEAYRKLEHYCAYQERCHKEVKQKLKTMHMIPEAIDLVVVHLLEHNFLNEARFAKSFVRGKFKFKSWGKNRLTFELKKKDISKYNINEALKQINPDDYLEHFNSLAQRRVSLIRETQLLKRRKKFVDYFLYRGWESHLVYEKARELIK